ncbi:MAG: hypothetical protein WA979_09765 [Pacificimonas sp.]
MTRDDWLMMMSYLLGAAVLSGLGPDLWNLPAPLAMAAAFSAAGCFAALHILMRVWQQLRPRRAVAAKVALPVREPTSMSDEIQSAVRKEGDEPAVVVAEPIRAASPLSPLTMQPIASLQDGRTRHFDIAMPDAADPAAHIAEVMAFIADLAGAGPAVRFFCELNDVLLGNSALRAELIAVLNARPELAGRLVFDVTARSLAADVGVRDDIYRLVATGYETCVRLDTPGALSESHPGTLRKLAWADVQTLTEGAVLAARRCGLSIILTDVDAPLAAQAARRLGLSLASGKALGTARKVRLNAPQEAQEAQDFRQAA